MTVFRSHSLLQVAVLLSTAMLPLCAQAQWWSSRTPVDYEECVETGAKASDSQEARMQLVSQCETKFAGRRKPGGGYTYFDFMQDRNFDIAGPNPTPEELRKMDEQYTEFLDQRRRQLIADAFAEKQLQQARLASLQQDASPPVIMPPLPKPRNLADKSRKRPAKPRPDNAYVCNSDPLSCGWTHLTAGLSAVKKSLLEAPPPAKKKQQ